MNLTTKIMNKTEIAIADKPAFCNSEFSPNIRISRAPIPDNTNSIDDLFVSVIIMTPNSWIWSQLALQILGNRADSQAVDFKENIFQSNFPVPRKRAGSLCQDSWLGIYFCQFVSSWSCENFYHIARTKRDFQIDKVSVELQYNEYAVDRSSRLLTRIVGLGLQQMHHTNLSWTSAFWVFWSNANSRLGSTAVCHIEFG